MGNKNALKHGAHSADTIEMVRLLREISEASKRLG